MKIGIAIIVALVACLLPSGISMRLNKCEILYMHYKDLLHGTSVHVSGVSGLVLGLKICTEYFICHK